MCPCCRKKGIIWLSNVRLFRFPTFPVFVLLSLISALTWTTRPFSKFKYDFIAFAFSCKSYFLTFWTLPKWHIDYFCGTFTQIFFVSLFRFRVKIPYGTDWQTDRRARSVMWPMNSIMMPVCHIFKFSLSGYRFRSYSSEVCHLNSLVVLCAH